MLKRKIDKILQDWKNRADHKPLIDSSVEMDYYTFLIDIYATKNLHEFTYLFGKNILEALKSKEKTAWESFLSILTSLRPNMTFDATGMPSWGVEMGDIKNPQVMEDIIINCLSLCDANATI